MNPALTLTWIAAGDNFFKKFQHCFLKKANVVKLVRGEEFFKT